MMWEKTVKLTIFCANSCDPPQSCCIRCGRYVLIDNSYYVMVLPAGISLTICGECYEKFLEEVDK